MLHGAIVAELEAAAPPRRDRYYLSVAAIWLCACALLCAVFWTNIASFHPPDPDDQLRLVEVRDWIAGQSFYDVSQHRMTPPAGAPMHWSRLVDMPIAALILLLRPFAGGPFAEQIAATIVPLVTLGLAMLLTGLIARRLVGRAAGLLATAFAATAVFPVFQMQPLRVDHHGWEIVLSLAAFWFALRAEGTGGAVSAGLMAALGLQVSLEGLPFTVALGGLLALHWAIAPGPKTRARLLGFMGGLTAAEAALFALLHRPDQWGAHCDAVSPPHLLGLAIATGGILLATARPPRARIARVAALGVVAAVAAAAFHAVPPGCGLDAFQGLEPIVRTYWYEHVAEGMPIWRRNPGTAVSVIAFPLIALACGAIAWRRSRTVEWAFYCGALAAATLVGATVLRASALSNMLAVPAGAWAALHLVRRVQASSRPAVRVVGSVGAFLALSPWFPATLAIAVMPPEKDASAAFAEGCTRTGSVRALAALPTGRIFAPLDFGPSILLQTPHAAFASGYHRNHAAIAAELRVMLGNADAARSMLHRWGIDYVVSCPGYEEMGVYEEAAPSGFAAQIHSGRAPSWLVPLAMRGTKLKVWRVR